MSERRRSLLMLGKPTTFHMTHPVAELRAAVDEGVEDQDQQTIFLDDEGEPIENDLAYQLLEAVEVWGFVHFPHPLCDRPNSDGTCPGHLPG